MTTIYDIFDIVEELKRLREGQERGQEVIDELLARCRNAERMALEARDYALDGFNWRDYFIEEDEKHRWHKCRRSPSWHSDTELPWDPSEACCDFDDSEYWKFNSQLGEWGSANRDLG